MTTEASPSQRADRCRAVLLGLVAGDRNGGPSRMALRLAESLCERRRFDPHDLLERYLRWWREGAFDTGPVAARVLALYDSGALIGDAVASAHREMGGTTAGCNPAHRSTPLAMARFIPDERLARYATTEAALSHHDPLAGDAAAASVLLCRALIEGVPWREAVAHAAVGRLPEIRAALSLADEGPGGTGGYAPEVLRAAVHFVSASDDLATALANSTAFAGQANYAPVLVGAFGGARWGAQAIPPRALTHRRAEDLLARVHAAADALAAEWEPEPSGA